jgi:hypothetical protein
MTTPYLIGQYIAQAQFVKTAVSPTWAEQQLNSASLDTPFGPSTTEAALRMGGGLGTAVTGSILSAGAGKYYADAAGSIGRASIPGKALALGGGALGVVLSGLLGKAIAKPAYDQLPSIKIRKGLGMDVPWPARD